MLLCTCSFEALPLPVNDFLIFVAAKLNKDWKAADAVRAEILAHGWLLEDTPGGGYRLKRAGEV